jgi:hypothetical protein
MAIYSDEYIEHWATVFIERALFAQRGIRFDTFLLDPVEILAAVEQAPRMCRLLEAQEEVMHRDIEESLMSAVGAQVRGSAYVVPLRHHARAVSNDFHDNRRVRA